MERGRNDIICKTLLTLRNGLLYLVHSAHICQIFDWTEFPVLNEILKKHGADEEEQLGQAQFALVLQPVLQDLADALAEKNIIIIQNIKIKNGSKLNKVTSGFRLSLFGNTGFWVACRPLAVTVYRLRFVLVILLSMKNNKRPGYCRFSDLQECALVKSTIF